jgi:hypothetical protein
MRRERCAVLHWSSSRANLSKGSTLGTTTKGGDIAMVAKALKGVSTGAWVIGGTMLLCFANYWMVQWKGYPPLYCWGLKLTPVFDPWWGFAKVFAVCFFAFEVARRHLWHAMLAAFACVIIIGLPMFFDILFRLGGTCDAP